MNAHGSRNIRRVGAIALVAALWACGASGGGISGTSLVIGPIADFGSIVVDGIEFDTDGALVTIEGDAASVADLRLGMVVFVRGTIDRRRIRGVADRVASDHLLQGPVETIMVDDGDFTALGQRVVTDGATVFDGTTLATLGSDSVEVFGFLSADGSIRATRVAKLDDGAEIEVTGTLSDLDEAAMTFSIGLLTVDFRTAIIENAPDGLRDGMVVEVDAAEPPDAERLAATGVELRDPLFLADIGDGIDYAGLVTEIVSADEFVLDASQRVLITADTRFEAGTRNDLVPNARVDVEGLLDVDGALVANEIEFVSGAAGR